MNISERVDSNDEFLDNVSMLKGGSVGEIDRMLHGDVVGAEGDGVLNIWRI